MRKIRRIIVGIISVTYLMLFFMKIYILKENRIYFLFILLANQVIDEWINYKETKRKIHLFIPIASLLLVIYAVSNLAYTKLT